MYLVRCTYECNQCCVWRLKGGGIIYDIIFVPATLLLVALANMPSGYYVFMRIIVSLASAIIAYGSYKREDSLNGSAILFGLMAILFNPIIPVYLYDREIWGPIDILGAIVYIIKGFVYKSTNLL